MNQMSEKKIRVVLSGRDARTAYISLPGHKKSPGTVAKTLRLGDLVKPFAGPQVHFDFNEQGRLIGIEILASNRSE
jgi:hypothetical protein